LKLDRYHAKHKVYVYRVWIEGEKECVYFFNDFMIALKSKALRNCS